MDKNKVNRYFPKNKGLIYAVQWTGKAQCLVDLPDFNKIVEAIEGIEYNGTMLIRSTDKPSLISVRPHMDYVVVDQHGNLMVWTKEFMRDNYNVVEEEEVLMPSVYSPRIELVSAERPDNT